MTGAVRPALPQPGRNAPAEPRGDAGAWLREVERARWAAQPRFEAGAASPEGGFPAAPDATGEGSPAVSVAGLADAVSQADGARSQGVAGQDTHRAQPGGATVSHAAGDAAGSGQGVALGLALVTDKAVATGAEHVAAGPQRPASARTAAAAIRQPYSVHVELGDGGAMAVWLRDARMGAQDALHLLERLSRAFAVSPAAGSLRLTVNGQAVQRGDLPLHFIEQERGERHGD